MKLKDKFGWMFVGVLLTLLILGSLGLFSKEVVKKVEVCEGVEIATLSKSGSGFCSAGCIQYKGEFVPYQTFKYLEEVCANRTSPVSSKEKQ